MLDFGIIVPCHLQDKYLDRIRDFRKYGLLNTKGVNAKIFLLSGSDPVPDDLKEDWPFPVEFVVSERFFDGPKVYEFVLGLEKSKIEEFRWWLKVDDDSATDMASQMKKMDEEYDWERPEYVFGDYGEKTEVLIEDAIKKTKHKDRFFHPNTRDIQIFHHEFESCVMSSSCLRMINKDEECRKLLRLLSSPENDKRQCWHDQGLAAAARFVKIHGSTSLFMTRHPKVDNFSLFGGRFTHIHWIHRFSPRWAEFLEKLGQ